MSDFLLNINQALNNQDDVPVSMLNSQELHIDDEFAALIPPLTPDEFTRLEQSIRAEGCREAIITWGNIIVDGHNRYRICKRHGITYTTQQMNFPDRNAVMLWMLQNQLARRNLNDFQRIEMVRKCEQAVKAQAHERQVSELKQNQDSVREIFPSRDNSKADGAMPQGRATDELGKMAGVSRKTYEHAIAVLDEAPAPVVEATRKKELSINSAYQVTKLPQEQQQEVSERISQGEKPSRVVADFQHKKNSNMKFWLELIPNARKVAKTKDNLDEVLSLMRQALDILNNAEN